MDQKSPGVVVHRQDPDQSFVGLVGSSKCQPKPGRAGPGKIEWEIACLTTVFPAVKLVGVHARRSILCNGPTVDDELKPAGPSCTARVRAASYTRPIKTIALGGRGVPSADTSDIATDPPPA